MKISYNCNMKYFSNITAISELSESEGVFTTAQAARMDISRDALAHSCRVGRLERICHGAYRMLGTQCRDTDELNAFGSSPIPPFARGRESTSGTALQ